jgi:hypothetical protein
VSTARPAITFACPACHRTLRAAAGVAGRALDCPFCDRRVVVPVTSPPVVTPGATDSSLPAGFPAHRYPG